MKSHLTTILFFLVGWLPCMATAQQASSPIPNLIYDELPVSRFNPEQKEQFSTIFREMQYIVFRKGDASVSNHFCAVGYRFNDGYEETAVIWSEPNWLIRWHGGDPEWTEDNFWRSISLSLSPTIRMNRDLVDNIDEMQGGTATTLRAGAESLVADCNQHGKHYTIEPFTPPEETGGYLTNSDHP